jgi:CheY-like chemotaxis protein
MAKSLVIDDSALVREVIADLLRDFGYTVVTADNGKTGLEAALSEAPDLILTDILMPEMDGLELIRAVRANSKNVCIVAMSGGGRVPRDSLFQAAASLGASEILPKPFAGEDLLRVVNQCMGPPTWRVSEEQITRVAPRRLGAVPARHD